MLAKSLDNSTMEIVVGTIPSSVYVCILPVREFAYVYEYSYPPTDVTHKISSFQKKNILSRKKHFPKIKLVVFKKIFCHGKNKFRKKSRDT